VAPSSSGDLFFVFITNSQTAQIKSLTAALAVGDDDEAVWLLVTISKNTTAEYEGTTIVLVTNNFHAVQCSIARGKRLPFCTAPTYGVAAAKPFASFGTLAEQCGDAPSFLVPA
jgi:hypothetical protein